jgi:hypothetical protein
MFPENVVQATMQRVQTKYIFQPRRGHQPAAMRKPPDTHQNAENTSAGNDLSHLPMSYRKKIENVHGVNILGF